VPAASDGCQAAGAWLVALVRLGAGWIRQGTRGLGPVRCGSVRRRKSSTWSSENGTWNDTGRVSPAGDANTPDAVVGLRPLDQQIEIKIGKVRSRRPIYKLKPISEPGSSLRANAMYASRIANIRPNSSPYVHEVPKWLDNAGALFASGFASRRDAAPPTAPSFHQPPPNKINMLTGRGSDPVRHLLGPHLASTSPPNGGKSDWHAYAVKSRPTTSAAELCSPRMVVVRHGRGWQATSPSARINFRTSSGPTCSPPRSSAACSRRYPEVPSEASNKALILILSSSRRWVWALWPLPPLSQKTQRNWISFKLTEKN
jgi:hypothetical protein